jgi:multicomponent Na+:H+ antiporter subunit G
MAVLAILLISAGTFFFFTSTVGLLRFPDFYSRMHGTGKGDTLGILLSLVGLAFLSGSSLTSLKILFIAVFVFITSPTATHALLRAAFDSKVPPWTKDGEIVRKAEVRRKWVDLAAWPDPALFRPDLCHRFHHREGSPKLCDHFWSLQFLHVPSLDRDGSRGRGFYRSFGGGWSQHHLFYSGDYENHEEE